MAKDQVRVTEKPELQWAKGWNRTPIGDRRQMRAWKKTQNYYRDALVEQLRRVGATEVLITYNTGDSARRDPGVTVYFSKPRQQDFSWQMALGIDSPAPTVAEIDEAYRKKAMEHHPDRGGDVEIFRSLTEHRKRAIAWITDAESKEHEFALPCDRFSETRWNMNALRLGIAALRRLEDYGLPGMLERSFRGFRVALPTSEEADNADKATADA